MQERRLLSLLSKDDIPTSAVEVTDSSDIIGNVIYVPITRSSSYQMPTTIQFLYYNSSFNAVCINDYIISEPYINSNYYLVVGGLQFPFIAQLPNDGTATQQYVLPLIGYLNFLATTASPNNGASSLLNGTGSGESLLLRNYIYDKQSNSIMLSPFTFDDAFIGYIKVKIIYVDTLRNWTLHTNVTPRFKTITYNQAAPPIYVDTEE